MCFHFVCVCVFSAHVHLSVCVYLVSCLYVSGMCLLSRAFVLLLVAGCCLIGSVSSFVSMHVCLWVCVYVFCQRGAVEKGKGNWWWRKSE